MKAKMPLKTKRNLKIQARIVNQSAGQDYLKLMRSLKVDLKGIRIMSPKGTLRAIYLSGVPSSSANILKQEMLSLGGEVALPKGSLFKDKTIDCLLLGTDSHLGRLIKKLNSQPYSLKESGRVIKSALDNFKKDRFIFSASGYRIKISRPLIMGILNVTPDSFSGDGVISSNMPKQKIKSRVLERAEEMVRQGVDLIDIGGESTRPGALSVGLREEINRVIPAVKAVHNRFKKIPLSVDTRNPETARRALGQGACIVNDITALSDKRMAEVVKEQKAGVVLMHMRGRPKTMQRNPFYKDVVKEVYDFLSLCIEKALSFGIDKSRIIVDAGFGFGKRVEDNLCLLNHLYQFKSLGCPVLAGVSRKSFIGKVLSQDDSSRRVNGTIAAETACVLKGAKILRVHDVKQAKEAIEIAYRIMSC